MRRALGASFGAVFFLLHGDAHAAAALASIASRAAKAVPAAGPALVVAAPLVTDVQAPRAEELAGRIAQLTAGAMAGATHASPRPATLAQARVLAGKEGARLVFLQPVIARGVLRVTVDGYGAVSNGWDRIRNPEPAPSAHAFVEAPIDAEVRAFLASIPLEHASIHRFTHEEGDVVAAACGDLDGDGGMDLVLVSRTRVASGHMSGGRFVPAKVAAWSSLAPRLPVPLREPIGGAAIVRTTEGDGEYAAKLYVGTTDRGGVVLDRALVLSGNLRGIPQAAPDDVCATASPDASALEGPLTPCASAGASARATSVPPYFDALALADIVRLDGTARIAQAARQPGGQLQLRLGDATQTLEAVGAQIALGDLDQDGALEVVTSAAAGEDAITVASWDGSGDLRPRLHLPAPAGVRALCVCPPEERGVPALVAVVGPEVWIVR